MAVGASPLQQERWLREEEYHDTLTSNNCLQTGVFLKKSPGRGGVKENKKPL